MQLEEQNRLVEQLKQALNASSNGLDKRLMDQKIKAEKSVKSLTQELNECNAKIASMEKEISLYKEKLTRSKAFGSKSQHSEVDFESGSVMSNLSNQNLQATGSFYINGGHSTDSGVKNNESDLQPGSARSIKVHKKDIRKLTEEELMKRSLKKAEP